MTRFLKLSAMAAAVSAAGLLAACAAPPLPPPALLEARTAVARAERDPAVAAEAPVELRKATMSLARADSLLASGAEQTEVASAAYVASQQARSAMAVAHAKRSESAIVGGEAARERARADARGMDAQRAEVRADRAELRSAIAQSQAADVQAQNTQLQQQLAELQARPTERGMLITLADVLFEFNKADVKPAAQTSLMKLADFLRRAPLRSVLIEGHTDNVGEPAYNVALSNRRAQAVKAALLQLGVADARVSTVGYGEEFPVAANSSDSNRAMNRRVEIYIADTEAPVRPRR